MAPATAPHLAWLSACSALSISPQCLLRNPEVTEPGVAKILLPTQAWGNVNIPRTTPPEGQIPNVGHVQLRDL